MSLRGMVIGKNIKIDENLSVTEFSVTLELDGWTRKFFIRNTEMMLKFILLNLYIQIYYISSIDHIKEEEGIPSIERKIDAFYV